MVNDPDDPSLRDRYKRLLEAAKEVARRNRERIDQLRRQFHLPDELTRGLEWEENSPSEG